MAETESEGWTSERQALWRRIEQHDFEGSQPLTFVKRLARDKGWTIELARRAVLEYRRFCFLAVSHSNPITPSEEVDEVWHLHLTYSRDYWTNWCPHVLERSLHHEPTRGGTTESAKFRQQYARTLIYYEEFFGPADEEFWPASHHRFGRGPRYRTIDVRRALVLPLVRPRWFERLFG